MATEESKQPPVLLHTTDISSTNKSFRFISVRRFFTWVQWMRLVMRLFIMVPAKESYHSSAPH